MTTRVLLVEDDAAVSAVVEILLATEDDFEHVATVTSAEEALAHVVEAVRVGGPGGAPDLVLLDNQLAGALTGLQVAPALKLAAPSLVVLLCTALDVADAASAGGPGSPIDGYLRKDALADLLDHARALLERHRTAQAPDDPDDPDGSA